MDNNLENQSNELRNQTPKLEKMVYENLPSILSDLVSCAQNDREKDILLLSGLTTYGAIAHNITGYYRNELVYPNLYSCIVAPAASGKGIMRRARTVAQEIQSDLSKEYESKLYNYRTESKQTKGSKPQPKPPRKIFLIPGNISSAALAENLQNNDGTGLIIETEIDTLNFANNAEFGSFSDMLRKCFHHEPISVSRKTDSEFIEIQNPRFAIAVSGTPDQILGLLNSAEDGLFSRFLFYAYFDRGEIDIMPRLNQTKSMEEFNALQKTVFSFWEWLKINPKEIELTHEQWTRLNITLKKWAKDSSIASTELQSSALRLGVIAFKIMMIITACRAFENRISKEKIKVTEQDFERAISIVETLKIHSELIYSGLPKKGKNINFKTLKQRIFWKNLPENFSRKEAIEIGMKFEIPERTTDKFLSDQVQNENLERVSSGQYRKVQ